MLSFLEAEMADSKDNPHEFWRKETVKDRFSLELESFEKKWAWLKCCGEALCLK